MECFSTASKKPAYAGFFLLPEAQQEFKKTADIV